MSRLRGPDRKAGRPGQPEVVEVEDLDARGRRSELLAGDGVELGGREVGSEKVVFVGGDIEAVAVRANMRIVAEASARIGDRGCRGRTRLRRAIVVGRALRAVVLGGNLIDGPGPKRRRGLAHRQVEVVASPEAAVRVGVQGQDHVVPALVDLVVVAAGVGQGRPGNKRRPVDLRGVAVEGVEVGGRALGGAIGSVHAQHVVDRLQDESVAGAEPLVGWLQAELVATVCGPLVDMVEAPKGLD